jgi:predicted AAA+ superfamily ATPase
MLVAGARQVGKTTFLRELGKKGRAYANLDDPGWMLDELGLEELK